MQGSRALLWPLFGHDRHRFVTWPECRRVEGCGIVKRVTSLRGPLAVRRMTAHWVVLAAAALTTLVAATVGAAFAVFAGPALPQAARARLVVAPGTTLAAAGSFA